MEIGRAHFRFIRRFKWFVIAFWAAVALVSAVFAPGLFSVTSLDFRAPSGTKERVARDTYRKHFPELSGQAAVVVLLRKTDGTNILSDDAARNATYDLMAAAQRFKDGTFLQQFLSYHTLAEQGASFIAAKYISQNKTTCMIQLLLAELHTPTANKFVASFQKDLDKTSKKYAKHGNLEVLRTGQDFILLDFMSAEVLEIAITDTTTTIIALLVLAVMLRSIALLVIPIINLLISACVSMALLYVMALHANVAGFDPAIMAAVLIAMAIDYSLFMLKRFRQEIDSAADLEDAVMQMILHAGRVVVVSGTTLTLAFLALNLAGLDFMSTLGGGAAIAVVCTILTNLTMTPALILSFPNFFCTTGLIPCRKINKRPQSTFLVEARTVEEETDSIWSRVARLTTSTEGSIVVLVLSLLLLLPSIYANRFFFVTIDNSLVFPARLPAEKAIKLMSTEFTGGTCYPFYFVAVASSNQSVISPEYFNQSVTLAEQIISEGSAAADDVIGISRAYGFSIPFPIAKALLEPNNTSPYSIGYKQLVGTMSEAGGLSAVFNVFLRYDPSVGDKQRGWVSFAEKLVKELNKDQNLFTWYLSGDVIDELGASNSAYSKFAFIVGVTVLAMVAIVAIAFRSIVLPVRLILTVGLTSASTFGIMAFIYCTPAFDWFPGLWTGGVYWFAPLLTLFVIFGLGIDYDIFLFSRVTEFFMDNVPVDEAIRLGCHHTGGVITGAGAVMAIAFSGLALGTDPALQQVGLFLVVAVLLDTFLVRLLVVPALLHLCRSSSWWPIKPVASIPYVINETTSLNSSMISSGDEGRGSF